MEEEHRLNNWDLGAVVRLFSRRRLSPTPSPQPDPFASFPPQQEKPMPEPAKEPEEDAAGWRFPDLCAGGAKNDGDGDELLRAILAAQPPPQQQPPPQPVVKPADAPLPAPAPAPARPRQSMRQVPGGVPRSKRRKSQVKKVVCHVPADGSSPDVWAWRKYGQKPIKGSPYPRGYYRCSTSKGCAARKHVERSRADPSTLILTYTGEHNHEAPTHRNSLAGTTRPKLPSPAPPSSVVVGAGDAQQTPSTSAGLSPTTPLRSPSMEEDEEEEEEEEDELLVEDMEMAGEDELVFLSGDADCAAPLETMSSLFDVDDPSLPSTWATAAAGEPAGAGS